MPRSSFHAASDFTVWLFSSGLSMIGPRRFAFGIGSWAFSHSLAAVTALVMTSSGVDVFLLNKRLLRAIQSDHRSQGVSTFEDIPVGGRPVSPSRAGQFTGKSINPLPSTVRVRGARLHTLWANSHWKSRWWIDSVRPHLVQFGSPAMFLDISLAPTGSAPWKVFQRKSLIFGATFSFQTPLFQSKSVWWWASSSLLIAVYAVQ